MFTELCDKVFRNQYKVIEEKIKEGLEKSGVNSDEYFEALTLGDKKYPVKGHRIVSQESETFVFWKEDKPIFGAIFTKTENFKIRYAEITGKQLDEVFDFALITMIEGA